MTEEKKQQVAKMLARTCHLEANYGGLCPVVDGGDCPFMEDLCQDVTSEDWRVWMEAEE